MIFTIYAMIFMMYAMVEYLFCNVICSQRYLKNPDSPDHTQLFELISQLLTYDPSQRCTLRQAMRHDFFLPYQHTDPRKAGSHEPRSDSSDRCRSHSLSRWRCDGRTSHASLHQSSHYHPYPSVLARPRADDRYNNNNNTSNTNSQPDHHYYTNHNSLTGQQYPSHCSNQMVYPRQSYWM